MRFRSTAVAALLFSLVALLGAGAAWAATSVTNVYSVNAAVRPIKSGTRHQPKPIFSHLEWDIGTRPGGLRPAEVNRYAIFMQGIAENTAAFASCSTSRLSAPVNSCPRSSRIGSGFLIFELGAPGFNSAAYLPTCSSSIAVFNGGHHDLTLFVYEGRPLPNQPTQCTIPGGHAAIHVTIRRSRPGITEYFRMPQKLSHPIPGFEAAVIQAVLNVPARQRVLRHRVRGRIMRRRVGLFQSYFCPRNHRRGVRITFTREDGIRQTAGTFARCR